MAGGRGLEEKIFIGSYKNTKADSMLSSARKRIITVAHPHSDLKLYSVQKQSSDYQNEVILPKFT